jgi:type IV secretory pathway VirB6-like protein
MSKILNILKETTKDKQLIGIVFIIISILHFIILSFIYNYTISIPILFIFMCGVYLLLKYSNNKWKD